MRDSIAPLRGDPDCTLLLPLAVQKPRRYLPRLEFDLKSASCIDRCPPPAEQIYRRGKPEWPADMRNYWTRAQGDQTQLDTTADSPQAAHLNVTAAHLNPWRELFRGRANCGASGSQNFRTEQGCPLHCAGCLPSAAAREDRHTRGDSRPNLLRTGNWDLGIGRLLTQRMDIDANRADCSKECNRQFRLP